MLPSLRSEIAESLSRLPTADPVRAEARRAAADSLLFADWLAGERWSQTAEIPEMQAQIDELSEQLRYADEDMASLVDQLCPNCRKKRPQA